MAGVLWWYYVSKFMEFTDTIVFILRKKNDQITFLHVYHHSTMPIFWFGGVRWVPGGAAFFGAMLNSGVHVIMYFYYFLAGMGPEYKKYLWWKKYVTKIQLVSCSRSTADCIFIPLSPQAQFYTVVVHTAVAVYLVHAGACDFPEWMGWALLVYCGTMIALFSTFYVRAYKRGERLPGASKKLASTA